MNKSFFIGVDTKYGLGNITYFTYFSEFNRTWEGIAVLEAIFMIVVCVVGLAANGMMLSLIFKKRNSRMVMNCLVCNLALADILFLTSAPLVAYVRITGSWHLGDEMCRLLNYGMFVCSTVIVWTMAVISIDRYVCINAKSSLTKKWKIMHVVGICSCIWVVLGCCYIPMALYFVVVTILVENGTVTFCTLLWPPGDLIQYSVLFLSMNLVLNYGVPVIIITVNYFRILRKFLISSKAVVTANTISRKQKAKFAIRKKDMKIVKALLWLVVLFILMWLPLVLIFVLIRHDLQHSEYKASSSGLVWVIAIAYINACVNPCLYGNAHFELRKHLPRVVPDIRSQLANELQTPPTKLDQPITPTTSSLKGPLTVVVHHKSSVL